MKGSRAEWGDWQTPRGLAAHVMSVVARHAATPPALVLEPTCGVGAFLAAAGAAFPAARLIGYEINPKHVRAARVELPRSRTEIRRADFFTVDWDRELARMSGEPLMVVGNPPWVTSAQLGVLGSTNLPPKRNQKGLSGYDALTGKSNFDVSEWMIRKLLSSLQHRTATLAVLCKAAVARRVIEHAARDELAVSPGGLWRIDAMHHFGAAVDAVLFVCQTGRKDGAESRWPVHSSLDAEVASASLAMIDGVLAADAAALVRTRHLAGRSVPEWRSGMKHDCARVMELAGEASAWTNGLGERVDIEEERVFPLLKSSDLAHGRSVPSRAVVVTQKVLGEDTAPLRTTAPRTWAYLTRHEALLSARKSAIYRGQPRFALFGVGPYAFAPWKVAISALYKKYVFTIVGPRDGRPVLFDDTCYFLPFDDEESATRAAEALRSPTGLAFFAARTFWDAKRPISKAILQSLDLDALHAELRRTRRDDCG